MAGIQDEYEPSIRPSRLPLGDDDNLIATANERVILDAGRRIQAIGDQVSGRGIDANEVTTSQENVELKRVQRVANCLSRVVKSVGIALDWLEPLCDRLVKAESGRERRPDHVDGVDEPDNSESRRDITLTQKKELVLRGLYHIIVLGSQTLGVQWLELASQQMDISDSQYSAQYNQVLECLRRVEERYYPVLHLIETASDILVDLKETGEYESRKVERFNSLVGHAEAEIECCRDYLSTAKTRLDEMLERMRILKYLSRGVRLTGWAFTCYGLYNLSSFIPTAGSPELIALKKYSIPALCLLSSVPWLSLYPRRSYGFSEELNNLQLKHELLTADVNYLDRRLKNLHCPREDHV